MAQANNPANSIHQASQELYRAHWSAEPDTRDESPFTPPVNVATCPTAPTSAEFDHSTLEIYRRDSIQLYDRYTAVKTTLEAYRSIHGRYPADLDDRFTQWFYDARDELNSAEINIDQWPSRTSRQPLLKPLETPKPIHTCALPPVARFFTPSNVLLAFRGQKTLGTILACLKAFDRLHGADGYMSKSDVITAVNRYRVHTGEKPLTWEQIRKYLRQLNALTIIEYHHHKGTNAIKAIELRRWEIIAVVLNLQDLGRRINLDIGKFTGTVKDRLYAAAQAATEKRRPEPRATKQKRTGIAPDSQRRYEKIAKTRVIDNYEIQENGSAIQIASSFFDTHNHKFGRRKRSNAKIQQLAGTENKVVLVNSGVEKAFISEKKPATKTVNRVRNLFPKARILAQCGAFAQGIQRWKPV